eukprot:Clim_evm36s218 gene=Clim_evmTU36s218
MYASYHGQTIELVRTNITVSLLLSQAIRLECVDRLQKSESVTRMKSDTRSASATNLTSWELGAMAPSKEDNIYETDELVSQYIDFHYDPEEHWGVPNFPKKCADICISLCKEQNVPTRRAYDIGCATGRSTLELATVFDYVLGIDFSERFVETAQAVKDGKKILYKVREEGSLFQERSIQGFHDKDASSRAQFKVGDACNLDPSHSNFDLIFCGNLIDRLYEPSQFLLNVGAHLNSGGLLVLTSPYTWLTEFTPEASWVGGKITGTGERLYTYEGLKQMLEKEFDEVTNQDVEFVIRETRRKYQHTKAHMTVWKKK